ncbi:nucleotidyltransferase domain-containing protein [Candidatus Sumerlaeota bacterium]|nr:nucleotidyltransferase domain-containing protein [Candidatus Sumerlaeota bacterium]
MDWADEKKIQEAVNLLLEATPRGSRVIVFGSRARGDARPDSDLDIYVIEPEVADRYGEMVRLAQLLGERLIPADVVVVSEASFEYWRETPNTLAWRVVHEGKSYERVA